MRRYFFDILDGDQKTPDDEGTELETREKACAAAAKLLPEIIGKVLLGGEYRCMEVIVREDQQIIYRSTLILFGECIIR